MNYIFAAVGAVVIVAIGISIWDLFFSRAEFEEMEYLP